MPLKDYLPKKSNKAAQEAVAEAERQRFFTEFEAFQKAHNSRLVALIVHDLKGSHVEFGLIPYTDVGTTAK